MSRLEVFVPTQSLFVVLAEVVGQHGGQLVFQRFESEAHRAGFTVFDPVAASADVYLAGDYRLIYVSLGPTPMGSQDWAFLDRAEAHLIELAGGRQRGRDLELLVARMLAKKSRAEKLFRGLREAIRSRCRQGVEVNGKPYPKMLHATELVGQDVSLWLDFDTRTISANIPAETDAD